MNLEQIRKYCLNKKGITENFPFDEDLLVFKVLGKVFALTSLKGWETGMPSINLKCDPNYAEELRATYSSIQPGYQMNKKHWNTISIHEGEVQPKLLFRLIDHSYDMVIKAMPKKLRDRLI
ncbi:MmcQ/YjbR family DNA-binding protein [Mariniflexile ostreae]|uniref:MmcQ/YjbR family DNA-binding protein n=1 Tax=Mariniflexile ostreae TaxID=1520892 RepID=A0ABV5FA06_9FLAO